MFPSQLSCIVSVRFQRKFEIDFREFYYSPLLSVLPFDLRLTG